MLSTLLATAALGACCAMDFPPRDDDHVIQLARVGDLRPGSEPAGPSAPAPAAKNEAPSDADRIGRLKKSIEVDQKQLESLIEEEKNPNNEFRKAEADFRTLDNELADKKKQIQALQEGGKVNEAKSLDAEMQSLSAQFKTAKDRFNLLIQERKVLQEKAAVLSKKIEQDQKALQQLIGTMPQTVEKTTPKTEQAPQPPTPPVAQPATPVGTPPGNAPVVTPVPVPKVSVPPGAPQPDPKHPEAAPAPHATTDAKDKPSTELIQAQKEVAVKQEAAREAKVKVESISARIDALRQNIALEQKLLETAQKKADQARQARTLLNKELQRRLREDPTKLDELFQEIGEIEPRLAKAQADVRSTHTRLNELQTSLNQLQQEQLASLREAKQKQAEVDVAEQKVSHLRNPFTPRNILKWLIDHGPNLLAILVGTLLLYLLVRLSSRQIARVIARNGERGSEQDRQNRALTLVGVVRNSASLALVSGGILMALDEVGIPILPLMGGAAVLGLAVAFGAQHLIRDYFSGFMVLMEDQYGIDDVVRIGTISGKVEKISLRMTVLRDIEGIVHFIPHGTITGVSNLTHGWSRAFFEIGVAYKEDPDRVMAVLMELGKELRDDPAFGHLILEDPEMLGVDGFGDSAVVIKFFLKTRPLQQWPVKRELLRRIKHRFDELGIEIPFPHRTVYHRHDCDVPVDGSIGKHSKHSAA